MTSNIRLLRGRKSTSGALDEHPLGIEILASELHLEWGATTGVAPRGYRAPQSLDVTPGIAQDSSHR